MSARTIERYEKGEKVDPALVQNLKEALEAAGVAFTSGSAASFMRPVSAQARED